ncbi:hypothetical protein BpHYR1_004853 [Brachionus plicatilis]|uniref:RNA-directed DNA polymerase from mobile element jockey-like n=1 Tax=Brachionus plicatilis TaxID=10195 RepID=A0A3M7SYC1_BRAPC|nr:hypothetical protein BpHYR1_004853 [Brachionus plicatilis]
MCAARPAADLAQKSQRSYLYSLAMLSCASSKVELLNSACSFGIRARTSLSFCRLLQSNNFFARLGCVSQLSHSDIVTLSSCKIKFELSIALAVGLLIYFCILLRCTTCIFQDSGSIISKLTSLICLTISNTRSPTLNATILYGDLYTKKYTGRPICRRLIYLVHGQTIKRFKISNPTSVDQIQNFCTNMGFKINKNKSLFCVFPTAGLRESYERIYRLDLTIQNQPIPLNPLPTFLGAILDT